MKGLPKKTQWWILIIGTLAVISVALLVPHRTWWQRQPVTFYAPLTMPIEVLKGDTILLPDGRYLIVGHNEKITAFWWDSDGVHTKAVLHLTVFEMVFRKVGGTGVLYDAPSQAR